MLEWGLRCIITKVFEPVVLLGYQWQLSRIAAEHGGTRTAYFYDLALRQKAGGREVVRAPGRRLRSGWQAARALEQGAVSVDDLLTGLDWDVLRAAKAKAETKSRMVASARTKGTGKGQATPVLRSPVRRPHAGAAEAARAARSRSPRGGATDHASGTWGSRDSRGEWKGDAKQKWVPWSNWKKPDKSGK